MSRALLVLHTARGLRWGQLLGWLREALWGRGRARLGGPAPEPSIRLGRAQLEVLSGYRLERSREVAELWTRGTVQMEGQSGPAADWSCPSLPRWWRSGRQHHQELAALAALCQAEPNGRWLDDAQELLGGWVRASPDIAEAWEPYTVARRSLAWSEAVAREPRLAPGILQWLPQQIDWTLRRLDRFRAGQQLLSQAAALLAGGSVLSGGNAELAFARGGALLWRELSAQLLSDGGLAQRSVHHHAVALRDALVALELARTRQTPAADQVAAALEAPLARMAGWLQAVRRADGSYPCLNDSTPEVHEVAAEALERAAAAGLAPPPLADGRLVDLPETGWTIARDAGCELLFEGGGAGRGPREPSADCHADALAFELRWSGLPVVTDSGATTLDASPIRDFERSPRAHATLSVDGEGIDELWGASEVARRGAVGALELRRDDPRVLSLAGRARSFRGWTHERRLYFWPGLALLVVDRVLGARPGARLLGHLPLDPSIRAAEADRTLYLLGPAGLTLQIQVLRAGKVRLGAGQTEPRDGWVTQGLGRPEARPSVELELDSQGWLAFAFVAPGIGVRSSAGGLSLRAPGSEVRLAIEGWPG
jgi:hypothetical protein